MGYIGDENSLFIILTKNGKDIDFERVDNTNKNKVLDLYNITLDLISLVPCQYHKEEGVDICIVGEIGKYRIDINCCCIFRETALIALSNAIDVPFEVSAYPYQHDENISSEQREIDIQKYIPDLHDRIKNFDHKNHRHYTLLNQYLKDDD